MLKLRNLKVGEDMKLVYLYVENALEGVIGRDLNFSSRYEICLDEKVEANGRTIFNLKLSKKDFCDDILYGKNVEVFGIVGDNGTGKSTILDYIRRLHYDGRSFTDECGFSFSIWEEKGQFVLYKNHFKEKDASICLTDKYSDTEIRLIRGKGRDFRTGIVYYSDIVDEKYVYNQFNGGFDRNLFRKQKNVSTSYYLSGASDSEMEEKFKSNNFQSIRNYFHNEVKRELTFIGDIAEKGERLQKLYHIPDKIEMIFMLTNFNVIEREILKNDLSSYTRDIHNISNGGLEETAFITIAKLLKAEYEALNNTSYIGYNRARHSIDYEWMLALRIEYNCIIDMLCFMKENLWGDIKTELDDTFYDVREAVYDLRSTFSEKNVFKENFALIRRFNDILLHVLIQDNGYGGDLLKYKTFIEKFRMFLLENKFNLKEESKVHQRNVSIEIPINAEHYKNAVLDLFQAYKKLSYKNWLRFSWGMSSGEKSKVTLFSRFYEVLKMEEEGDTLLLLDELDYYMHPSWQQNILSDFVMFLNTVFPDRDFQIVFTTHSPITLSDVRKDNILFLSNENSKGHMEETFAANIASLYLSAFSMRSGSIGAVGANFFKNVLASLNTVKDEMKKKERKDLQEIKVRQELFLMTFYKNVPIEINSSHYETEIRRIRHLIEHIGEDIYRIKLLERFDECNLLAEAVTMEKEIERLLRQYGRADVLNYMNKR